jgi:hypothetical protein
MGSDPGSVDLVSEIQTIVLEKFGSANLVLRREKGLPRDLA